MVLKLSIHPRGGNSVHKLQDRKKYRLFYTVPAQNKTAYHLLLKDYDTKLFSLVLDDRFGVGSGRTGNGKGEIRRF